MAETITSDSEKQQPFETRVRPCRALCDTGDRGQPVCNAGSGPGPPWGLYYEALQSSLIPHTFSRTLASVCPRFPHMLLHVSSCVSNDSLPQNTRQKQIGKPTRLESKAGWDGREEAAGGRRCSCSGSGYNGCLVLGVLQPMLSVRNHKTGGWEQHGYIYRLRSTRQRVRHESWRGVLPSANKDTLFLFFLGLGMAHTPGLAPCLPQPASKPTMATDQAQTSADLMLTFYFLPCCSAFSCSDTGPLDNPRRRLHFGLLTSSESFPTNMDSRAPGPRKQMLMIRGTHIISPIYNKSTEALVIRKVIQTGSRSVHKWD